MANPYFNAVYYLQQNPDVFAAGYTVDTAWNHYAQFGANEGYANGGTVRAPNPWFDVKYYLNNNPDLIAAGITPAMALDHFTTYGMTAAEDRAPNATVAASPITEASLLAYANANADLQTAFGIPSGATELTAAQQNALISHFYQYGYDEDRPSAPTTVVIPDPNQGQTFTLTASGTTGSYDNITGTTGDDSFIAGPGTAETGDVLNGAGGTDVLKIQENGSGRTMAPTMDSIEQVWLNNVGNAATTETFLGSNATGIKEVWADRIQDSDGGSDGDGAIAFSDISKAVQLGVYKGATAAANRTDVTFNLNDITGTADEATLVLDQASVRNVNFADGVETLNIKTQGGASRIDGILDLGTTTSTATKLVFTGDQNATVDAIDMKAANYSVDASALTGSLTITLEDSAFNETFIGGKGNDTLYTAGTNFAAGDSFDGGEGDADVISIAAKATITAATGKLIKNFEIFDAAGANGAAAGDYDMDLIKGDGSTSTITGLQVSADLGGATQIDNLAKGADVTVKATTTAALTIVQKGAADAGSNSDVLDFELTGSADVTANSLVAANIESVNIASTATEAKTTGHTITASTFANATTITFTGDEQITVAATVASGAKIDASAMTDKFIMSAAFGGGGAQLVLGGSAADTLVSNNNAAAASVLQGNGGADTITLGAGGNAEVVKFAAASDSTLTAYDKVSTFTTTEDDIDLSAFGFSGASIASILGKGALTAVDPGNNAANFFDNAGVDRAVAWGTNGGNTYVYVDADKDGDFNAANDLVVELTGIAAVAVGDFVFA